MINYLIDIDGTITDDIPNEEVYRMVTCEPKPGAVERVKVLYEEAHAQGGKLVFFTSRTELHEKITEQWLVAKGFRYDWVIYGKPRGGNYVWIDNLDVRAITYYDGYWTQDGTVEEKILAVLRSDRRGWRTVEVYQRLALSGEVSYLNDVRAAFSLLLDDGRVEFRDDLRYWLSECDGSAHEFAKVGEEIRIL